MGGLAKELIALLSRSLKVTNGPVAQLNRVSDYGSEGSRFESLRGH